LAYPDKPLSEMSLADLQRLIRQEVYSQIPPIPSQVAALGDADSPLIFPPGSDDGEGLFYNSSTGQYEPNLVDAPNLAANIILATQLIAGDPNAARVEVGVDSDSNTGVRSFDASSANTFNIDAQDGSVYVKGRLDFGTASRLLSNDVVELAGQTGTGFATPARVQAANATYDGFTSSNDVTGTVNITWGAATAPGNLLLLVVTQKTASGVGTVPTLPTVSGWTQVQTASVTTTTSGRMRQTVFKIENAASRFGSEGIALTGTSNTRYLAARMFEYSGTNTIDVTTTAATGVGTTATSGATGALAQAGELLAGAICTDMAGGLTSPGLPTPDLSVFSDGGRLQPNHSSGHPSTTTYDLSLNCFELATAFTATQSVDASLLVSAAWIAQLFTFKADAATATPTTPATGIVRVYAAADAAGNPIPHTLDAAGNAASLVQAPAGTKYSIEFATATVSIPSTAAGATGSIAVTLSSLAVGDIAIWAGLAAGTPFFFFTDPVCTSAGSITLRFHNSDDGAAHALASTLHSFLIIHKS